MIAQLTTVTLFLAALAAAQGNVNGQGTSSPSFSFAPTATDSTGAPVFAADAQRTMSSETQLDAPTTTAPTTTPSNVAPHPAPMTPVTESSETQLATPTTSPTGTYTPPSTPDSTSPEFSFAPTTTSESSPSFAFAPTTSSQQFSFQPQTTPQQTAPQQTTPQQTTPQQTVPQQSPGPQPETAVTAETETQLQKPTTTPEFTYAPSSTKQEQQPTGEAPVGTPSFTYSPPQNSQKPAQTSQPAGNPVENNPVVEQSATTLQQPSNHADYQPTTPAQGAPKKSTITGAPVVSTIHVTQASNGNFMMGSLTLTNNAEITQGVNSKFPTQIVELQSSSQLVIENAKTTATQMLSGNPVAPPKTLETQFVRPLPPPYGSISLNGGYILSAAPETYVTLNGHKLAVSTQAVPTENAVTWKGHTMSMSGMTLAAKPTGAHHSSESSESVESKPTSSPSMADSGVGRVGVSMMAVIGAVALLL